MATTRKIFAATGLMVATLAMIVPSAIAANSANTQDLPFRGISMDQVEKFFGDPKGMQPPVGEPPISRWFYDDYTVYFEYDLVIHSVPNYKNSSN